MKRFFNFTDGKQLEVGTFYGIGKNYAEHANEMGGEVPKEPLVFIKPPSAYVASGDKVFFPDFSNNVHHELELVVIIGKDAYNVSEKEAKEYIAGYAVGIDLTCRDVQQSAKSNGTPWAVAKGFYTSAPVSDIVPIERVDKRHFELFLSVNGVQKQHAQTEKMERNVDRLVSYLSKVFSLQAGDAIFTGTPKGVGSIAQGDTLSAQLEDLVSLEIEIR